MLSPNFNKHFEGIVNKQLDAQESKGQSPKARGSSIGSGAESQGVMLDEKHHDQALVAEKR